MDPPELRAALAAAQLVGLIIARYAVKVTRWSPPHPTWPAGSRRRCSAT
ncbi:TetR/AcrR family transcriptional regulator [Nonomuraea deserti]